LGQVESIESLGDQAVELQEFSTKPGTDLALRFAKNKFALRSAPQDAHEFIGLFVNFSLRRAQPVDGDFDKLGGLLDREQYLKAYLLGAVFERAVDHRWIDRAGSARQNGRPGCRRSIAASHLQAALRLKSCVLMLRIFVGLTTWSTGEHRPIVSVTNYSGRAYQETRMVPQATCDPDGVIASEAGFSDG
jgi:hypothetical protein